ncbi:MULTISPECIES: bifunctional 4-hydroxy-2-oxoglutarate aldolase/2-dehydro-3-deoxy-phosphogluconate aldolase [Yersinia]|uniref:bifunctional 4-hydroxy-2-oxoglutarate aldolase/2-dehydro-3-deoxy-phosphogluconate aldolase n=1 Tax=Yersinia TaxID=629 RepID=UPI0005E77969|nr:MULTISPECIES: bifunctional 4-hydroxy-2-oxoglutarate aldolase/2-dehydro-3-deoxy-phosphogluconate aldolase [Yersinia]RXA95972.1 bifunctional 4-hydroxy-2-oxoglutarate aldolase/2-dehydro-3-deoxy-phosphogluconate aldolase [Yersinia sp. 2105 StPb PI]CNK33350.1 keto-hydroxyglutarate-aldolase/keto-deoxy-phosphogluconate aldolase [Yersinia frederiksenii]
MIKQKVIQAIEDTGIIAIARHITPEQVLPLAQALYDGGIRVIEVTCNTSGFLQCIEMLSTEFGDKMYVGAGTVLNPIMAQLVLNAGANFVLAPDFNPEVVKIVHEHQRLMIPAVVTPSEMMQACRMGIDLLKLFPANALGIDYLKEIRGPLDNLALIAVGGVTLANTESFAKAGAFAVGVGSELINKQMIADGNWQGLTKLADNFVATFRQGKCMPT